jgi:hypothetical protein
MDHAQIITELGGIRGLARKLDHPIHTTVQGWYQRNSIPIDRWQEVIAVAEREGKPIGTEQLLPVELRGPSDQAAA